MCLSIFSCCSCFCSAETLHSRGTRPFREGTKILENKHNQGQRQRAYGLVAEGLSYYKLAESQHAYHNSCDDANFSQRAQILIASFCASSICSNELKTYLIEHGIFSASEYQRYRGLFQQNKFTGPYRFNVYRPKADQLGYQQEVKGFDDQQYAKRKKEEKERKEREEIESASRRHKEYEEWKRQCERDKYEMKHPEAKYQRETSESAREQVELLKEKNRLSSDQAAEQARQSLEQTRLLEKIAADTYATRRAAEGW